MARLLEFTPDEFARLVLDATLELFLYEVYRSPGYESGSREEFAAIVGKAVIQYTDIYGIYLEREMREYFRFHREPEEFMEYLSRYIKKYFEHVQIDPRNVLVELLVFCYIIARYNHYVHVRRLPLTDICRGVITHAVSETSEAIEEAGGYRVLFQISLSVSLEYDNLHMYDDHIQMH